MEICITYGGKKHCIWIPILEYPVNFRVPGIGPINYPALLQDAILVASIREAANKIYDTHASAALHSGVTAALKAMQAHAGEGVEIHADAAKV